MKGNELDQLTTGLRQIILEYGQDRACADANWLQNVLADHSPQTPALNHVAALAVRQGVPGRLQGAAPGAVDAVVAQAVRRLASAHAIEAGAAHDAVSAWARALGLAYVGTRPTSAPVTGGGGGRVARRIQRLLDAAEAAEEAERWKDAMEAYDDILAADAAHTEAIQLRAIVLRRLGGAASAAAGPVIAASSGPSWRVGWMSDCGEDIFGRWEAVRIAGVEHRFRYCAPGKFEMGSPSGFFGIFGEAGRDDDEGPQHEVTLTQGFWLGETPVTQRLWAAVAGSNPSYFKGPDLPVECVSWADCEAWIVQASARSGGLGLRFPTEAEWEYACRAGTTGATYRGDNDDATLDAIAWYDKNSSGKTHPVKQKAANPWGLYDMLGLVLEWNEDSLRTYDASAVVDPNAGSGERRVYRGGSWIFDAQRARAADRAAVAPDFLSNFLGFRLARNQ